MDLKIKSLEIWILTTRQYYQKASVSVEIKDSAGRIDLDVWVDSTIEVKLE